MSHERRPSGAYYQDRTGLLSQGDVFLDVPLAYPTPADSIVFDEEDADAGRRFLSGPFETGPAILTTPTCSMRSQGGEADYAHPVRTLVPLRPVEELLEAGILDSSKGGLAPKLGAIAMTRRSSFASNACGARRPEAVTKSR